MSSETIALEAGVSVQSPPRENIVRAIRPGVEIRTSEDGSRTLAGHFAVFNEWTEIKSRSEGHFLERVAPGAFKKTFRENRDSIKVLFDHGQDPSVGNKPLGKIRSLAEDDRGASYEVDLLDTGYVRDLVPALEQGLLGASFRFRVMREEFDRNAAESDYNPDRLPERTIKEAAVAEFGPVVFPAYAGATAGVRSLTDDFEIRRYIEDPVYLRMLLLEYIPRVGDEEAGDVEDTPPAGVSVEPSVHPVAVRRSSVPLFGMTKEEKPRWQL